MLNRFSAQSWQNDEFWIHAPFLAFQLNAINSNINRNVIFLCFITRISTGESEKTYWITLHPSCVKRKLLPSCSQTKSLNGDAAMRSRSMWYCLIFVSNTWCVYSLGAWLLLHFHTKMRICGNYRRSETYHFVWFNDLVMFWDHWKPSGGEPFSTCLSKSNRAPKFAARGNHITLPYSNEAWQQIPKYSITAICIHQNCALIHEIHVATEKETNTSGARASTNKDPSI